MEVQEVPARSFCFVVTHKGVEIGRAYLYLIQNGLHVEPYGLLEDMYVSEAHRERRIGSQLLSAVITRARGEGCYKLIANSRNGEVRAGVHSWYVRAGFAEYGKEFRMDL